MAAEQEADKGYDARITALEVGVKAINNSLKEFKGDVDGQFDHLNVTLQAFRSEITVSGRTDWKALLAGLAVLLAIIGFIGNSYVRDQERTEADVGILQGKFQGHEAANGIHYSLREQVLNNAQTVKDNLRTHEAQVEGLTSDIDKIRDWQEKHAERAGQAHTRSDERLKSIERQVFK